MNRAMSLAVTTSRTGMGRAPLCVSYNAMAHGFDVGHNDLNRHCMERRQERFENIFLRVITPNPTNTPPSMATVDPPSGTPKGGTVVEGDKVNADRFRA